MAQQSQTLTAELQLHHKRKQLWKRDAMIHYGFAAQSAVEKPG